LNNLRLLQQICPQNVICFPLQPLLQKPDKKAQFAKFAQLLNLQFYNSKTIQGGGLTNWHICGKFVEKTGTFMKNLLTNWKNCDKFVDKLAHL